MPLAKIKRLRQERINKINALKEGQKKIDSSDMYSNQHKSNTQTETNKAIKAIEKEYGPQINELIDQRETELLKGFNNAEYSGMDDKQATIALLKEMRNQKQTDNLIKQYEGKNHATLRSELGTKTKELVKVNSPETTAYINAMKSLGAIGFDDLEQEYKANNMNDLQKAYQSDLNIIEEQKQEFATEVSGDPFANAMEKYE